ncbi:cytochrome c, partial [Sinorhizobium meliloti]
MFRLGIGFACFATSAFGLQPLGAAADDPAIARGEYLVT